MTEYTFPPFHSFPPSFTKQPVDATRAKQTQLWCDLIRDYCRVYRIFWLDVSQAQESSLFSNPAIDRRLSDEDIRYFLSELVARGDGQWDPDRKRCLVFWRRPSEWGELIYQWVEKTGRNGELLTVHEIRKGTRSVGYGKYGRRMICRGTPEIQLNLQPLFRTLRLITNRQKYSDFLCDATTFVTEFHDLELDTTLKALQALQAIGKCVVVQGDSEDALVS